MRMWIVARRTRYSREFRECAVALVFEQVEAHGSQWEAICSVAKLNVSVETVPQVGAAGRGGRGDAVGHVE